MWVVAGEGGGDGPAEGVANEVEGVGAGPSEVGGGEGQVNLGCVETGVVGEVGGRVGVAATEEVCDAVSVEGQFRIFPFFLF